MGSFVFKWEHPANEVYVTGTFDDWSKSERLDQTEVNFLKNVTLPNISEKIYYKFVVDGNWVTDHTAPQEKDESGNLNNVLTTDRIIKNISEMTGIISGATPDSTTASLAGAVPLEKDKETESSTSPEISPETTGIISGVTPDSTTALLAGAVPLEKDKETESSTSPEISPETTGSISGVTPDSTTALLAGAVPLEKDKENESTMLPGTFPETPTPTAIEKTGADFFTNPQPRFDEALNPTLSSSGEESIEPIVRNNLESGGPKKPDLAPAVKTHKNEAFSIAPIPAFGSLLNPSSIYSAENLLEPNKVGTNTVNSSATKDKESFTGTGGLGNETPVLPSVITEKFEFDPLIQSAGPQSSTAALAAAVPLTSSKPLTIEKALPKKTNLVPEANVARKEKNELNYKNELSSVIPGAQLTPKDKENSIEDGVVNSDDHPHTTKVSQLASELIDSTGDQSLSVNGAPEFVKQSTTEENYTEKAPIMREAVVQKKGIDEKLPSHSRPDSADESALTPAASSHSAPSRAVSPLTIPIVGASRVESKTNTAHIDSQSTTASGASAPTEAEAVADNPAILEKTEKKKKRTSIFGKIKAKLTHKDKD